MANAGGFTASRGRLAPSFHSSNERTGVVLQWLWSRHKHTS